MGNYEGNDNYGKPKSEYLDKLKAMDDKELREEHIYSQAHAALVRSVS